MSEISLDEYVETNGANLRQGDVIEIASIVLATCGEDRPEVLQTPEGIAVVSQTCDLLQASKTRCIVAPVTSADKSIIVDARKGRKPLHLYLGDNLDSIDTKPRVADLEMATSVPKTALAGSRIDARYTLHPSGPEVAAIAARIGRAFTRFPFPGEVYPIFSELRSRIQKRSGSPSAFGRVIDLVIDLRVSADQWTAPRRHLKVWVVIPEHLIAPPDDHDPGWSWGPDRVREFHHDEPLFSLNLHRICELILANQNQDLTTLTELWIAFGSKLKAEVFRDSPNDAVTSINIEVLSETEMTYQQYRRTESLDLEALSMGSEA